VFSLRFALGCLLSSTYGFLAGAWPFGVLEAVWCLIAVRRYAMTRAGREEVPALDQLVAAHRRPKKGSARSVLGSSRRTLVIVSGPDCHAPDCLCPSLCQMVAKSEDEQSVEQV
jgi:hypothetical protein